jgi:hypothetical protein
MITHRVAAPALPPSVAVFVADQIEEREGSAA